MSESEDKKPRFQTSEFWLSLITTILSVLMVMLKDGTAIAWASGIAAVMSAGVYALFQTPLPSDNPGVKSKVFWTSVVTIVGSMAVAVSEMSIPGIPPAVIQVAGMISAAIAAGGYTIHRRQNKLTARAKLQARLKPEGTSNQ